MPIGSKIAILLIIIEIIGTALCSIINAENFVVHEIRENLIQLNPETAEEPIASRQFIHPYEQKQDNGIDNEPNLKSFEQTVLEMTNYVKQEDVPPCSQYDPPTPNFRLEGRRISEEKCLEHIWETKKNEENEKRVATCNAYPGLVSIIGGRPAEQGEFPHMGGLGWIREGKYAFYCGSFIVSRKVVVTAAHCRTIGSNTAYDKNSIDSPKFVRFGVRNIMDDKADSVMDRNILSFIAHKNYKPDKKSFDIAVVTLEEEIDFNDYIQPACLLLLDQNVKKALITGWGANNTKVSSPPTSDDLLVAEVDIVPFDNCSSQMRKRMDDTWKLDHTQICATRKNADICWGDSGGPLQSTLSVGTNKTIYNAIGVASFGFYCGSARFPSIYTRISSYIDWIEDQVWGNEINHKNP